MEPPWNVLSSQPPRREAVRPRPSPVARRRRPQLSDPRVITILSTEHWSLLTARSLVYNEMFTRGGMFLTLLSASLVALGFVYQGRAAAGVPASWSRSSPSTCSWARDAGPAHGREPGGVPCPPGDGPHPPRLPRDRADRAPTSRPRPPTTRQRAGGVRPHRGQRRHAAQPRPWPDHDAGHDRGARCCARRGLVARASSRWAAMPARPRAGVAAGIAAMFVSMAYGIRRSPTSAGSARSASRGHGAREPPRGLSASGEVMPSATGSSTSVLASSGPAR